MGIFKIKGPLGIKVYFLKLDALVEKPLAKCVPCQIVRKKHQHPTLNITPTQKKIVDTISIDLEPSQNSSILYFLNCQLSQNKDLGLYWDKFPLYK